MEMMGIIVGWRGRIRKKGGERGSGLEGREV